MARISLSGIVNENGISKTNYTGKGNGRLKFISKCGELWSNPIEIDDYLFLGTGRTTDWYGTNITLENNIVKWTVPSSNQYLGYRNTSATDLRNKTITTTVRINSEHIRFATYVHNGTSWVTMSSVYVQSDVETTLISKIPSNAQQVWIRIQSNSTTDKLSEGDEVYIEKWEMSVSPTLQHYTPISIASSSSIIQTGESATLTATLTNVLGEPMANTSVDFIESDAVLFKYNGRTGVTETDEFIPQTGSTVTKGTDGVVIENTATTTGFVWANLTGTSTSSAEGDYYGNFTVECELLEVSEGYNGIIVYETNQTGARSTIFYPNGTGHLKLVRTGNHFDCWLDDVKIINRDFELTDPLRIGVRLQGGAGNKIKLSDFKIIGNKIVTSTTNTNGIATTTITSNGTGERTFKAVSNNVESENMNIEDYIYYKEEEIISYSSDTNYTILTTLSELPSKFELSFDYKTNGEARIGLFDVNNFVAPNNPNYSVFVGSPNGSRKWYYGVRITSTNTTDVYASPSNYHHYTIRRNGNTFYYQRDGVGSYSKTATWFDAHSYVLGLLTWGTDKQSSVKNIILKTLE